MTLFCLENRIASFFPHSAHQSSSLEYLSTLYGFVSSILIHPKLDIANASFKQLITLTLPIAPKFFFDFTSYCSFVRLRRLLLSPFLLFRPRLTASTATYCFSISYRQTACYRKLGDLATSGSCVPIEFSDYSKPSASDGSGALYFHLIVETHLVCVINFTPIILVSADLLAPGAISQSIMSNLYYNYRGDSATRPPPSHSASQHLGPPKDTFHHAQSPPMSYPISAHQVQLRGANAQGNAVAAAALGFPTHHAWAAEQTPLTHGPPSHVSQAQHQHRATGAGVSGYPAGLSSRSAGLGASTAASLNGGRTAGAPQRSTTSLYDEGLMHMLGKPFGDGGARVSLPSHASTSQASSPPAGAGVEHFTQLRGANTSSNVFDPSEFPTLGGTASTGMPPPTAQHPTHSAPVTHSLLTSSPIEGQLQNASLTTGPSGVGAPSLAGHTAANGLPSYHELFSITPYGEGRAKAVDALTGSAAAGSEFNMQSEDFPALGGQPASSIRMAGHSVTTAPNSHGAQSPNDKPNHSPNALFDRTTHHGMIGGNVAPGRTHMQRSEHGGNGLGAAHAMHIPNGFDMSETLSRTTLSNMNSSLGIGLERGSRAGLSSDIASNSNVNVFRSHAGIRGEFGLADTSPQLVNRGMGTVDGIPHEDGSSEDSRTPVGGRPRHGEVPNPARNGAGGFGLGGLITTGGADSDQRGMTAMSQGDGAKGEHTLNDSEKYGMKALLPMVLPLADGKGENVLSVGLDLTALGLNLNSSEPLHKTFESPWDGGQGGSNDVDGGSGTWRNKEPEYKLPTCYYMQPPSLRSSHFTKFQLETLFYIFYNMPRDVLQLLAAVELYKRKWRYHKDLKLWFSCDAEAMQSSYEQGKYVYFDIKSWERRPFHDANQSFIQGLMTEDELNAVDIPQL